MEYSVECSASFSTTLQTEFSSTKTSDFLKQIIILKSFNFSVKFDFRTINDWFGSMVLTRSGILLNNQMADFSLLNEGNKLVCFIVNG